MHRLFLAKKERTLTIGVDITHSCVKLHPGNWKATKPLPENLPAIKLSLGNQQNTKLRLGNQLITKLRLGNQQNTNLRLGNRPITKLRLGNQPITKLRLENQSTIKLFPGNRLATQLSHGNQPAIKLRLGISPASMPARQVIQLLREMLSPEKLLSIKLGRENLRLLGFQLVTKLRLRRGKLLAILILRMWDILHRETRLLT